MNELEVLRRARKLIEREENWSCDSYGDGVTTLCLLGALNRADRPGWMPCEPINVSPVRVVAGNLLRDRVGPLPDFNDTHSHAEVLALLDDVIATLEEQHYGQELAPLTELVRS